MIQLTLTIQCRAREFESSLQLAPAQRSRSKSNIDIRGESSRQGIEKKCASLLCDESSDRNNRTMMPQIISAIGVSCSHRSAMNENRSDETLIL